MCTYMNKIGNDYFLDTPLKRCTMLAIEVSILNRVYIYSTYMMSP